MSRSSWRTLSWQVRRRTLALRDGRPLDGAFFFRGEEGFLLGEEVFFLGVEFFLVFLSEERFFFSEVRARLVDLERLRVLGGMVTMIPANGSRLFPNVSLLF